MEIKGQLIMNNFSEIEAYVILYPTNCFNPLVLHIPLLRILVHGRALIPSGGLRGRWARGQTEADTSQAAESIFIILHGVNSSLGIL